MPLRFASQWHRSPIPVSPTHHAILEWFIVVLASNVHTPVLQCLTVLMDVLMHCMLGR